VIGVVLYKEIDLVSYTLFGSIASIDSLLEPMYLYLLLVSMIILYDCLRVMNILYVN
jgi:hypothetical protein